MPNEPLPTLPAPDPSTPEPSADRAADVAMMLAAVVRMETVVRGERTAFDRLRADLDDMASTVVLAKAALASFAIKPDDASDGKGADNSGGVNALLQAIEDRVKAMAEVIEAANVGDAGDSIMTQPPVAAAAAPAVVIEQPDVMPAAEYEPAPAANVDTPSSAMLESMIEALAMPQAATPPPEPVSAAPEPEPQAAPFEETPPALVAPPSAIDPAMPDIDLMASFAHVEAMPVLPSEVGTAVIFAAKEPEPQVETQIETQVETQAEIQAESQAESQPESHAAPVAEAEPEAPAAVAPQPEIAAEPPGEATPAVAAATPIETPEESSSDDDAAEFLFEPDPDPAADLLEPIAFVPPAKPPAAAAAILPAVALATRAAPSLAKPASNPVPKPTSRPAPEPTAPHDPLAPFKSMSDEEKIALFS